LLEYFIAEFHLKNPDDDGLMTLFCSLAAVARQIKFYNVTLITAGGLAWDFSEKKDRSVNHDYDSCVSIK
jgi:hypothetical protein